MLSMKIGRYRQFDIRKKIECRPGDRIWGQTLHRPGGARGYRPSKANFIREGDSGQFWGADFQN